MLENIDLLFHFGKNVAEVEAQMKFALPDVFIIY